MEGPRSSAEPVGSVLRGAREARDLSLDDVRVALGIPLHYLQAMEGGGGSGLVADEFYLVPFLRRYADYLGLDGPAVVAQFLAEFARGEQARPRSARAGVDRRWRWTVATVIAGATALTALWLLWSASFGGARSGVRREPATGRPAG